MPRICNSTAIPAGGPALIKRQANPAGVAFWKLEMSDSPEPVCPYVTGTVTRYCTLTPFTLTDAEREALAEAARAYADNDGDDSCVRIAATLFGLLERTAQ